MVMRGVVWFKFQISLTSCVTLMSLLTSVSLGFLICKMEQISDTSRGYREEKKTGQNMFFKKGYVQI